jgi:hypothetical protein
VLISTGTVLLLCSHSTYVSLLYISGVGEFRKTRHPRNVKFDKVLETCFSGGRKLTIFGSPEPVKPQIRERAKFGNLDSME